MQRGVTVPQASDRELRGVEQLRPRPARRHAPGLAGAVGAGRTRLGRRRLGLAGARRELRKGTDQIRAEIHANASAGGLGVGCSFTSPPRVEHRDAVPARHPGRGDGRLGPPIGLEGPCRAYDRGADDRKQDPLQAFVSALHWYARAAVNRTPITGLERRLHYLQGDARLALRAVRESVLQHNREGRTALLTPTEPVARGGWHASTRRWPWGLAGEPAALDVRSRSTGSSAS